MMNGQVRSHPPKIDTAYRFLIGGRSAKARGGKGDISNIVGSVKCSLNGLLHPLRRVVLFVSRSPCIDDLGSLLIVRSCSGVRWIVMGLLPFGFVMLRLDQRLPSGKSNAALAGAGMRSGPETHNNVEDKDSNGPW